MSSSTRNTDSIDNDHLPDELQTRNQWVCWRYHERSGEKAGKLPVTPETGDPADVTDPSTWGSFFDAVWSHEYEAQSTNGIGFVFTSDDPYVGIDLDDCVDEDGTVAEWARHIIDHIGSFAEYSPSGKGIHIILKGTLPDGNARRENIEMYEQDRFFTVTGKHVAGTPPGIEAQQDALEAVYEEHFGPDPDEQTIIAGGGAERPTADSGLLSDDELLVKAKRAENGAKFRWLWNGDTGGYESQSEADEALCCELAFWTGGDRQQIDRLFRQSGLMRPKWDEKRGGRTYGERTIDKALTMVTNHYTPNYGQKNEQNTSENAAQQTGRITIDDVKRTVLEAFDERTWKATEAVLAAHATLLLTENVSTGLVLVGPSGSGKTTVLRFFEDGLKDMFYRSDDVTPASFVSHDASKSDDQLEEIDLLPRLKGKTLLSRDMATWFAGDEESISKRMAVMTHLLDGEGYTRDTGTHGQRGYTGADYRFNFVGASTPLPPRAWRVMGNVGNRLVFHEVPGTTDLTSVIDAVVEGSNYDEKIIRCQSVIQTYFRQLWDETGGYASVEWQQTSNTDPEVKKILEYLTRVVQYGRAPVYDGAPQLEGGYRLGAALWTIARGRALLDGRQYVTVEDMAVCARVALSTMPKDRRPVVRALLNPQNGGELLASEVEQAAGISRPTAHERMQLLATLGFAECGEVEDDGRGPTVIELRSQFKWPDELPFPEF